jgi:hypothetical protein
MAPYKLPSPGARTHVSPWSNVRHRSPLPSRMRTASRQKRSLSNVIAITHPPPLASVALMSPGWIHCRSMSSSTSSVNVSPCIWSSGTPMVKPKLSNIRGDPRPTPVTSGFATGVTLTPSATSAAVMPAAVRNSRLFISAPRLSLPYPSTCPTAAHSAGSSSTASVMRTRTGRRLLAQAGWAGMEAGASG